MNKEKKIQVRVRLIIIKNEKILLSYTQDGGYYFYIGGRLEFGETLKEACEREIKEECAGTRFTFKKVVYIRDFILPQENEHSVEFYILGEVDKFKEIDGIKDEEYEGRHWQSWIDLKDLPKTEIKPETLTEQLLKDYKNGFKEGTKYLGQIK
ncbi:MAG TPA: NUDIX domain-containing protein [Clostridia bacterium]|nr:NUDIX domain-containing protein [Clostridia bacterium]